MLVLVKKEQLLDLMQMHTLAMKVVFKRHDCTQEEFRLLEHNIEVWSRRIDLTAHDKSELKRIINALIAAEEGHFKRSIDIQKKTGLHYNQIFKGGLPYIDVKPYDGSDIKPGGLIIP